MRAVSHVCPNATAVNQLLGKSQPQHFPNASPAILDPNPGVFFRGTWLQMTGA